LILFDLQRSSAELTFGHKRGDSRGPKYEPRSAPRRSTAAVDAVDRRLLGLLAEDATLSYAELGRR
jgi:hypothetical protein